MSNEFIAPPLPILSFGTVGESELPFPNYSIPISNELKEDPTIINLKHVAQAVLKAKRVAVVCGEFTLLLLFIERLWWKRGGESRWIVKETLATFFDLLIVI